MEKLQFRVLLALAAVFVISVVGLLLLAISKEVNEPQTYLLYMLVMVPLGIGWEILFYFAETRNWKEDEH